MVKKIDLKQRAADSNGEYVFGAEDTGSHACYLIYGVLKPGEKGRVARPGKGHEEMLLAVHGTIELSGHMTGRLAAGEAIHLSGEQTCHLVNRGSADAVYVLAGGHSDSGHH